MKTYTVRTYMRTLCNIYLYDCKLPNQLGICTSHGRFYKKINNLFT
jgi:hypothetical protein